MSANIATVKHLLLKLDSLRKGKGADCHAAALIVRKLVRGKSESRILLEICNGKPDERDELLNDKVGRIIPVSATELLGMLNQFPKKSDWEGQRLDILYNRAVREMRVASSKAYAKRREQKQGSAASKQKTPAAKSVPANEAASSPSSQPNSAALPPDKRDGRRRHAEMSVLLAKYKSENESVNKLCLELRRDNLAIQEENVRLRALVRELGGDPDEAVQKQEVTA